MKNKLTRKLMLSAFTLLFAVISLGASTYAWFTLSKDAEVQAFDAKVTVGSGLQIQAVAKNAPINENAWQTASLIVNKDLYKDVIFQAATPSNKQSTADGFIDASANSAVVPTTGYITFDLHFKLTTPDTANKYNLYFDGYTLTSSNQADWTIDKTYKGKDGENAKYNLGEEIQYWVSDAARLAITPATGTEKIYQAASGSDEYTASIPTENNAAVNYYNAVNTGSTLNVANASTYTAETSVAEKDNGQLVGTLTGSGTVKVTVTVWIEGWDGECINAIFSQVLSTTLSFYLGDKQAVAVQG
jgi:hypothetical protein